MTQVEYELAILRATIQATLEVLLTEEQYLKIREIAKTRVEDFTKAKTPQN